MERGRARAEEGTGDAEHDPAGLCRPLPRWETGTVTQRPTVLTDTVRSTLSPSFTGRIGTTGPTSSPGRQQLCLPRMTRGERRDAQPVSLAARVCLQVLTGVAEQNLQWLPASIWVLSVSPKLHLFPLFKMETSGDVPGGRVAATHCRDAGSTLLSGF